MRDLTHTHILFVRWTRDAMQLGLYVCFGMNIADDFVKM